VSKRLIDVVIARWIVNFIRYGEGEGEGEGEMERERKVLGPGWAESLFFFGLGLGTGMYRTGFASLACLSLETLPR
jgi:hypothetical protein